MMLYPAMSELLKEVNGRYLLVNLTARRAREISEYSEENQIELSEKPVSLAVGEIAEGKLTATPVED
ncbi:MAG: DNA-directed RNA polymerase subunit omega [Oscillospiraceae bacterium]|nr:DNA-directed RNA polymerase subunit omega [Oscillospiraceae bacterium]